MNNRVLGNLRNTENNSSINQRINNKAFDELFKELYIPIVFYTNGILGNLEISEDTVQDVFIKYWSKFSDAVDHSFAKNYLYKSAHNAAIDYVRHQKVERKRLNSYLLFQENEVKIDDIIACDEIKSGIKRAMLNLPDRCLEVFQLSRDEGLTYSQIAKRMSISIKTVETQMSKALRIFRRELDHLAVA